MALGEYAGWMGLYHLNGSSADTSWNNFSGSDTLMTYPAGRLWLCWNFSGSWYITLWNNFNFERTDTFTVAFWINYNSDSNLPIVQKNVNALWHTGKWRSVMVLNRELIFQLNWWTSFANNELMTNTTTNSIPASTRARCVVTYNGNSNVSGVVHYINWKIIAAWYFCNNLSASILNTVNASIWAQSDWSSKFTGQLDDIVIEKRLWSPQDVRRDYTQWKGRFAIL